MVVIGGCLIVFGGVLPGVTLLSLTTLIMGTLILTFLYSYATSDFPSWTVWIGAYFSYGLGFGLGLGSMKWPKIGVLLLGAAVGFIFG